MFGETQKLVEILKIVINQQYCHKFNVLDRGYYYG